MAITFDSFSHATSYDEVESWEHTCSGTYRVLFVTAWNIAGGPLPLVSVTYGGVALTKLVGQGGPGFGYTEIWYLISPPTGSNTVVVTFQHSNGNRIWNRAQAVSFNGGNRVDSGGGGYMKQFDPNITWTGAKSGDAIVVPMGIPSGGYSNTLTAPTHTELIHYNNTSSKEMAGALQYHILPSDGDSTNGWTDSGNSSWQILVQGRIKGTIVTDISYAGFTNDGIIVDRTYHNFTNDGIVKVLNNNFSINTDGIVKVKDNIILFTTDGIIKILNILKVFVADGFVRNPIGKPLIVSEFIQDTYDKTFDTDAWVAQRIPFTFTTDGIMKVFTENSFTTDGIIREQVVNCIITTSNYKWLSSTLLTAQQQYAVRPYAEMRIVDDQLVATQIYTNPDNPKLGKCVVAPDGTILMVGKNPSDNSLGFWKITDGTIASQWTDPPTLTIDSTFDRQAVIQVSDWINGTYVVDIYWFKVSGGDYHIWHSRSTDGGTSFGVAAFLYDPGLLTSEPNLWLTAGQPVYQSNGTTNGVVFWNWKADINFRIRYLYYNGTAWGSGIEWAPRNINSYDWILHSFDVIYANKVYNLVFSGYHQFLESTNGNYSLYVAKLIQLSGNTDKDIWSDTKEVLTSLSPSPQNQNTYKLPTLSYDGTTLFLVFQGITVDAVKEDGSVITHTTYFLSESVDFTNFRYPTAIVYPDGTEFTDTSNPLDADKWTYSLLKQGANYFLCGGGSLWKLNKNNYIANVTDDLVNYNIRENAAAPSAIKLEIGNQNGKWAGVSPTETGYQAIAKNKKIILYQGYYNALGNTELVPKNTYHIDDIKQLITSNQNALQIEGRDWHKKSRTSTTRFTYSFKGADFYLDAFDTSTLGNWNQKTGNWIEQNGEFTITDTPSATDYLTTLAGIVINKPSMMMSVLIKTPTYPIPAYDRSTYIYPYYQDSDNYLRLKLYWPASAGSFNWSLDVRYAYGGSTFNQNLGSGQVVGYGGWAQNTDEWLPIYIQKYSYSTYRIWHGYTWSGSGTTKNNNMNQYDNNRCGYLGEFNLDGVSNYYNGVRAFALGGNYWTPKFAQLKITQFADSQNLKELLTNLGTKAGIYNYDFEDYFKDYFFDSTKWTGAFTLPNRTLELTAGNMAMRNDGYVADAEIKFDAKVTPANASLDYGFDFLFRNQSTTATTNTYLMRIQKRLDVSANNIVSVQLRIKGLSNDYIIADTTIEPRPPATTAPQTNDLRFALTDKHTYKVVFNKGWTFIFIDGVMYLSWYDNNVDIVYSTGYFGFQSHTNSMLKVYYLYSPVFYPQVKSFGLSPGDDIDTAMNTLSQTIRGFLMSDLMGRMKGKVLLTTDPETYLYQDQLWFHQTDKSDKEYANQVTVVGDGVSAVARDNISIGSNVLTRDVVVVDYKIKTYADAQTRADLELNDFVKFNAQSDPKQVNNLGAELLDVVHLRDTGANSSNVDATLRVYNQTINMDGRSNDYSIALGLGSKL